MESSLNYHGSQGLGLTEAKEKLVQKLSTRIHPLVIWGI